MAHYEKATPRVGMVSCLCSFDGCVQFLLHFRFAVDKEIRDNLHDVSFPLWLNAPAGVQRLDSVGRDLIVGGIAS